MTMDRIGDGVLSPARGDLDSRILGRLLVVQSVFSVFTARQKMSEFVCRAVEGVPGLASAAVCLPGAGRPRLDGKPAPECADCDVPEGDVDHDPSHPCRLSSRAGIQILPLQTQDRHFGFFFLKVNEPARYSHYAPFVGNLVNGLTVSIERQWQRGRLEAANVELRGHREHLEGLVRERTAGIQRGLKREHHLNAVLRAIRNVNQLIVREQDRERLLQQACEILVQTRALRSAWAVRLGGDGRVEATAEAGIGPAFAGLRSQLERGELPECCRRALASEGPVVVANPHVDCAACPLPTESRDAASIAAPLRHEGRTCGVLIAALPAEMAADAEEISLFAETAGDLAFALRNVEVEQARQQAEEALRVKDWAIESAINAMAISDLAGSLSYVNPAFVRQWGCGAPAEILGRSVAGFWQMGDKAEEVAETVRTKGGWSGDLVAQRKDGVLFDVHVSSNLVLDATGQPVCMQASFEDITERKRAQEALQGSEARYRTLFEHSADGILIADLGTKVFKHANPAVCRMLGYTAEEMRTIGIADIHPKDALPRVATEFEAQTRGEKTLATDLPCLRKDGTVLYADVNATTAAIDDRPCLVGFFRDTTGRKRAEEALIRSLEATLTVLGRAAEMRDPYTAGHQRRVTELAIALARKLGFPDDECDTLRIAGMLHDIGKLGIPAEILSKPSQLSAIEFSLIREHPQTAYNILTDVPFSGQVAEIVLQHHERLDGSGYPRALTGDQILREARILAVADVVEAMVSHRPYRPALGIDAALKEIRAGRGTRYDQQVVDACAALFESGEFSFSATS